MTICFWYFVRFGFRLKTLFFSFSFFYKKNPQQIYCNIVLVCFESDINVSSPDGGQAGSYENTSIVARRTRSVSMPVESSGNGSPTICLSIHSYSRHLLLHTNETSSTEIYKLDLVSMCVCAGVAGNDLNMAYERARVTIDDPPSISVIHKVFSSSISSVSHLYISKQH